MMIFGRKRYLARQKREELNHRVGVSYGMELFRMDCPRPAYEVSPEPGENAFRVGVQVGYTAAEMEFEDEVGWFLAEKGAEIVSGFETLLAQSDPGPLDIHGGAE